MEPYPGLIVLTTHTSLSVINLFANCEKCGPGWAWYDGRCFLYVKVKMSWAKAESHCRTYYTDLASVRTSAENSKLLAVKPSGESYWLGLYRDTWKWSNGDGATLSYWTSGQPDGSTEHCSTAYFSDAGRWRDWLCVKINTKVIKKWPDFSE
uniref:C-type lectin domain-containing protein n=1 Tax=Xiphophorus couchianus TaxID=32473 RepID=A0A3B5MF29_9TELE